MADCDPPPPSKASLLKWWKAFTSRDKQKNMSSASTSAGAGAGAGAPPPAGARPVYAPPGRGLERGKDGNGRVFGVSLEQSLQYASVAISMVAPDGKQYVYGYVPIVVAKCGMMLKETATQTEGIFRVSGSNKRINQLQAVFDEPPRYGKDFDWTGYSVHDAASVLRRYLNSLPEPVIPAGLYLDFTAVLQRPQPIADSIAAYRHLISLLPPASRYLLLYLLDFLSVFARCSSKNLMTASNLAVVFQPGLVSSRREGTGALLGFPGFVEGRPPPSGAQEQAGEHGRGKEVLEFLIEQQAHFMLGLEPPVDAERQKKKGVEAVGAPQPTASTSAAAAAERGTGLGAAGLARRGSEKSVERRRLRKSHDAGKEDGKVKRSKTWGSSSGKRHTRGGRGEGSPSPNPETRSSHPSASTPSLAPQPSRPHPSSGASTAPIPPSLSPPLPASTPRSPHLGSQPTKKPRKSGADDKLQPPHSEGMVKTGSTGSSSSAGGGAGKGRRKSTDPETERR
ncbi:hypothetical protein JCM1840_006519 [Sporobolomyces johnsonii]